ncbi:MAG: DUF4192 domain-containing protein [Actinobacteria bacterium]|nr:DUF4192 domain-containing protein [Actinomycetota bacterium]
MTLHAPDPRPLITLASDTPPGGADKLHSPEPPPEILRCSSTADFLAALPSLAGFTAENSLFVVCFQGNRGGNVIRIDLPDSDAPKVATGFLDCVVSLLHDTGAGAERPALAITTTLSFAESGAVPRGRLAHQIKRRFRREGWQLRELAVIASDGWCGLLGESGGRARPLSEIEQSPIAAKARRRDRSYGDLAMVGTLPQADPARTAAVQNQLRTITQRQSDDEAHGATAQVNRVLLRISRAASVADTCLRAVHQTALASPESTASLHAAKKHQRRRVPARLLAKFIDSAQQQQGWLVCVLTVLTRAEFVVEMVHDTGAERFAEIALESVPDSPPGPHDAWSIRHLLTSLSYEMPPRERLRSAIAVTEDAIVHAPAETRPALYALLAWAWWALGMQSVAARIVGDGLALAPKHKLLVMVQQLSETPPAAHLIDLREQFANAA